MHIKVEQVKDFTYQKNKYKICSLRLDMGGGGGGGGGAQQRWVLLKINLCRAYMPKTLF